MATISRRDGEHVTIDYATDYKVHSMSFQSLHSDIWLPKPTFRDNCVLELGTTVFVDRAEGTNERRAFVDAFVDAERLIVKHRRLVDVTHGHTYTARAAERRRHQRLKRPA